MTYRETLEGLLERARQTGKADKVARYEAELAMPPFPVALDYLWAMFWRLRRRKGGGMGPEPITWADLDGYCRFAGQRIAPWEVEAIEALDNLFLASIATLRTRPVSAGE